jgi:predicted nucleic acid-binding protein
MMITPVSCVVDASVAIKLVVSETDSPQAHALFAPLSGDPAARFIVPDLFFVECGNILWKKVKRGEFHEPEALAKLAMLSSLPLELRSSKDLMERALRLAIHCDATAYDALYVATADHLTLPLITADDKLVKKFAGGTCQIHLLIGLAIPIVPTPLSP